MRIKSSILSIAVLMVITAMSAQAAVVPIFPGHMQGWSIWAYNLGYGELCTWGPPAYENDSSSTFVSGRGGFYAETDLYKGTFPVISGDQNPSTVWFGTDTWKDAPVAGKTLASITAMNYYSWTSTSPMRFGDGAVTLTDPEYWTKTDYWRFPQQPLMLQLTMESPDGTERRQVWCMPWGYNYTGDDLPKAYMGRWEKIDCMLKKWYMPQSADLASDPDAYEMGFPTWTEVLNHALPGNGNGAPALPPFKDWKLIATNEDQYPTGSRGAGFSAACDPPGHPVNSNGTGKPINFFIGARISKYDPLFLQGNVSWSGKYNGFRGCIDSFTLGFGGQIETYNFEPAPTAVAPRVVATTVKAFADPIMGTLRIKNQAPTPQWDYTQRMNLFKFNGKVTLVKNGVNKNDYFVIDDGSGLKYTARWQDSVTKNWIEEVKPAAVWIYLDPPTAGDPRVGDYLSAYGFVETLRFAPANTPPALFTVPGHIYNYSY